MQTPIDPLVAEMVEQLDLDLREAFEERAAIIEYEADVQRAHAEALALLNVLDRHPDALSGVTVLCVEVDGVAALLHGGLDRPRARARRQEGRERDPRRGRRSGPCRRSSAAWPSSSSPSDAASFVNSPITTSRSFKS